MTKTNGIKIPTDTVTVNWGDAQNVSATNYCKKATLPCLLLILSGMFSCSTSPYVNPPRNYTAPEYDDPENFHYWKTIAASSEILVISGSSLLADDIMQNQYYEYNIPVIDILKGSQKEETKFKIYMETENYNYISSISNNEKVIVFLQNVYDGYGHNNYLEDYYIENAILVHTDEIETIIRNEIILQEDIIENELYRNFDIDTKMYNKVARLIKNTKNIFFQNHAFTRLENLGTDGLPYIILLMDNYNKLPIQSITLRNKGSNSFEAARYYSPELVIDALAAILNQITGEDFVSIYNGEETNDARLLCQNGWRIYLYKINLPVVLE